VEHAPHYLGRHPKGAIVKKVLRGGIAALVAAAVLAGTAWAGTASSQAKTIPFVGSYKGMATVKINDNVADIAAAGAGKATLLKASKITGKGKGDSSGASTTGCVPFTGPGSIVNTKGVKLNFLVTPGATGCGSEDKSVPVSITGRVKITKGTKAFKGAKGTLKLTGSYSQESGAFAIKLTGKVTLPK
jgi:hypothetical protein